MKKNATLERIRKRTGNDVKRNVDLSMAIADRIYEILVTKKGKDQKYLANLMRLLFALLRKNAYLR